MATCVVLVGISLNLLFLFSPFTKVCVCAGGLALVGVCFAGDYFQADGGSRCPPRQGQQGRVNQHRLPHFLLLPAVPRLSSSSTPTSAPTLPLPPHLFFFFFFSNFFFGKDELNERKKKSEREGKLKRISQGMSCAVNEKYNKIK